MKNHVRYSIGRTGLAAVALFLILLAQPAWAYLDPGTGSMIISAIVGLFATVGLAINTSWYKIKAFFRKDNAEVSAGDEAPVDTESPADR